MAEMQPDNDDGIEATTDEMNQLIDEEVHATKLKVPFTKRNSRCMKCAAVVLIAMLVAAAIFVAGLLAGRYAVPQIINSTSFSNTSSSCGALRRDEICTNPPLLLVSLDGFWAGYFERNLTNYISKIGCDGVQVPYMKSAFPTKTFPNHFTIVTGLYPESHGIVSNSFYDRDLMEYFHIGSADQNDPKWWLAEPVWVTAAKSGLRTGVFFWPGSEVPIEGIRPDYYFTYNRSVPFEERVNTVLGWLDLPNATRPQFMAVYFSEPDHSGHEGGPDSEEVNAALVRVDETVKSLFAGLEERRIADCVNIMIVSDHGMAAYNSSEHVYLDDFVPSQYSQYVNYTTLGVSAEIIINNGDNSTLQQVYSDLVQNINEVHAPVEAYLRDDIPFRLHAAHFNKQRYGDIYIIGNIGSFITTRNLTFFIPPGEHGYDNDNVHMQAIFLAHGPAFKKKYTALPFENIQLYNLMCNLLNITPSANNGTAGELDYLLDW